MAIQTLFGTPPPESTSAAGGSLLDRLKAGIQKTRSGLMEKLEDAVSGRKEIDSGVLDELEFALITADIGASRPQKSWNASASAWSAISSAIPPKSKASSASTCWRFWKPPSAPSRKSPSRPQSFLWSE